MSDCIVIAGLLVQITKQPMEGQGEEFLFGTWTQGPVPTITVNSSCTEAIQTRTLLHEVLEAINDLHGIGLQEEQICCLETGLADTIGRNPEFFRQLASRLEVR